MAQPPYVDHCVELLSGSGAVRVRRMFGGWGLYLDELFVALILNEQLYLKVGEANRKAFAAEGCAPFVYEAAGKQVSLGFWSAPPEAMDSPALMAPWVRLAQQAALSAAASRAQRAPRAVGKVTPLRKPSRRTTGSP
jgi:DNA transformation protein